MWTSTRFHFCNVIYLNLLLLLRVHSIIITGSTSTVESHTVRTAMKYKHSYRTSTVLVPVPVLVRVIVPVYTVMTGLKNTDTNIDQNTVIFHLINCNGGSRSTRYTFSTSTVQLPFSVQVLVLYTVLYRQSKAYCTVLVL